MKMKMKMKKWMKMKNNFRSVPHLCGGGKSVKTLPSEKYHSNGVSSAFELFFMDWQLG